MKEITLSQGKVALVDCDDYEWLSAWQWYAVKAESHDQNKFYAVRKKRDKENRKPIFLHRVIMGAEPWQEVDHRDNDGLNNRRINLRLCSHSQNMANSVRRLGETGFRGVRRSNGGFRATLHFDKKWVNLGTYATPDEAAAAWDIAAFAQWGEFAKLNNPENLNKKPPIMRPGDNRGEKAGTNKLTTEQVLLIRQLRCAGESVARLASSFGISEAQVSRIVLRQRWTHI